MSREGSYSAYVLGSTGRTKAVRGQADNEYPVVVDTGIVYCMYRVLAVPFASETMTDLKPRRYGTHGWPGLPLFSCRASGPEALYCISASGAGETRPRLS
jgi:hypothetical protein